MIERDMAVEAGDFLRSLGTATAASFRAIGLSGDAAIGNQEADRNDDAGGERRIAVACEGRRVIFTLAAQEARRLGSMRLPSTRVQIVFEGFSAEEAARFLSCFDARYRRGGG